MENTLIKYERLLVIERKNGDLFFAAPDKMEEMVDFINSNRMIRFGDKAFATNDIADVYIDHFGVAGLSDSQRRELFTERRMYKQRNGKEASEAVVKNMIDRIRQK